MSLWQVLAIVAGIVVVIAGAAVLALEAADWASRWIHSRESDED